MNNNYVVVNEDNQDRFEGALNELYEQGFRVVQFQYQYADIFDPMSGGVIGRAPHYVAILEYERRSR